MQVWQMPVLAAAANHARVLRMDRERGWATDREKHIAEGI
jgi:hypothetical protein